MANVYCGNCGKELIPGRLFCLNCGEMVNLDNIVVPEPVVRQVAAPSITNPPTSTEAAPKPFAFTPDPIFDPGVPDDADFAAPEPPRASAPAIEPDVPSSKSTPGRTRSKPAVDRFTPAGEPAREATKKARQSASKVTEAIAKRARAMNPRTRKRIIALVVLIVVALINPLLLVIAGLIAGAVFGGRAYLAARQRQQIGDANSDSANDDRAERNDFTDRA